MSTIRKAIDEFMGTEEEKRKQRELLTLLSEASEDKAKVMINDLKTYIRTAGSEENKTIPVSLILGDYQEIRVTTQESAADIAEKIKEAVKDIMAGNILDGVIKILGDTLNTLLGSASASEMIRRNYFVCVEGLSMVRYDIFSWSRSITIESLKKSAERSLICLMTKSSIDVKKLDFNAFLNIYQSLIEKKEGITIEELLEDINNAKKLYKTLIGDDAKLPTEFKKINISDLTKYLTTLSKDSNSSEEWPKI